MLQETIKNVRNLAVKYKSSELDKIADNMSLVADKYEGFEAIVNSDTATEAQKEVSWQYMEELITAFNGLIKQADRVCAAERCRESFIGRLTLRAAEHLKQTKEAAWNLYLKAKKTVKKVSKQAIKFLVSVKTRAVKGVMSVVKKAAEIVIDLKNALFNRLKGLFSQPVVA